MEAKKLIERLIDENKITGEEASVLYELLYSDKDNYPSITLPRGNDYAGKPITCQPKTPVGQNFLWEGNIKNDEIEAVNKHIKSI